MVDSQREKLKTYPHNYLSIGVTAGGEPCRSGWVPWDSMGNAFNMKIPEIYFTPEDLTDEGIWAELSRFHINGCYIFCPLSDYSFLARLPELWCLTIYQGGALRDLGFLRPMEHWFQLHVEDAVLENLDDLFPSGPRRGIHSYCVCLAGCTVKDISALTQEGIYLSELVILAPEGSNDKARWKAVRCGKYTYHEYRLPTA
ncbi:MAG: hypothetical protein IKB78_09265 [Clostridia bacterium]|nr:hypothetical protein [Clostridia bacterium]